MDQGRFIAFEGGEGTGKSTQSRLLADALEERGITVVCTREPGGTPAAEALRALLLAPPEGVDWEAAAEALLFAAARADHVARVIRPALGRGAWVVCDRFLDSSRAYQGGAGGIADADLLALHRVGSDGLMPDLTVLIEAPFAAIETRLAARDAAGGDRIGARDTAYHERVAAAFARIAAAESDRFARVDGRGSVAAVHARVMGALAALPTLAP